MTPEEAEGVTKALEQEVFGASESRCASKTLKEQPITHREEREVPSILSLNGEG